MGDKEGRTKSVGQIDTNVFDHEFGGNRAVEYLREQMQKGRGHEDSGRSVRAAMLRTLAGKEPVISQNRLG